MPHVHDPKPPGQEPEPPPIGDPPDSYHPRPTPQPQKPLPE